MSTEDQNRCVVTAAQGVDVDQLMDEIVSGKLTGRKVEMFNEKNDSLRNFDVVLTANEVSVLQQDPRIVDVRWGSKQDNGIILTPTILDSSRTYSRSTSQDPTHYAWAFPACLNSTNPFSSTSLTYQHPYTAIGENTDVIIQDSGVQVGHPEWLAQDGVTSRLQLIDWPSAAGLSGTYTQGALHYTDTYGHGTHCMGTAAGRRYGWAKAADIYAIKIFDDDAFGVSASFNLMRNWHNRKASNKPTVVNMSWGYYNTYAGISGGVYRGTPWSGSSPNSAYGMVQTAYNYSSSAGAYTHPIRVASVDADIEDCLAAGLILVAAAGNDTHKIDVSTGQDYNNYFTAYGSPRYYHRGSTPNGPSGVISVGAVQASNNEYKSAFSCCGPGVHVYAPGEAVQSAMPPASTLGSGSVPHPDNAGYYVKKIQGTSMASPQVTGALACLVSNRPDYTSQDCIDWLAKTATKNRLADSGSATYTDVQSLQGSPNRYLYWPFNTANPLKIDRT